MSQATITHTFPCSLEKFYAIISDFEKYPEFLPEVKSIKIIKREPPKSLVEFQVSMVKSFSYRIWLEELPPHRIQWTLESGEIFKTQTGSWDLKPVDGGKATEATYSVAATFGVFVPSMITKKLVEVSLPGLMRAYEKRVQTLYG